MFYHQNRNSVESKSVRRWIRYGICLIHTVRLYTVANHPLSTGERGEGHGLVKPSQEVKFCVRCRYPWAAGCNITVGAESIARAKSIARQYIAAVFNL